MNNHPEPVEIIINVNLSNGERRTHTFTLPGSEADVSAFAVSLHEKVLEPMLSHRRLIYFPYPTAVYNPDHVVGIEIQVVAPEELRTVFEETQERQMTRLYASGPTS